MCWNNDRMGIAVGVIFVDKIQAETRAPLFVD